MQTRSLVLGLLLAASAALSADQGPSPAMRARLDGFVRALTTFDAQAPEPLDRLREEAFTASLKERLSAARFREMAARLRADFGPYKVREVRRTDAGSVVLVVDGEKEDGRITLGVEQEPPHLITSVGVALGAGDGDGDGDDADAPSFDISGTMSPAELTDAIDRVFTGLTAREEFSGAVMIAKDGIPVVQKAYGYANRETRTPNAVTTRFNIGSINKAFTQIAIRQLVEQGRFALTDTIGELLPDHPNKDAHPATVDQLLNHTGGIANFLGAAFDATPKDRFRSNADYYRFVAAMPLTFAPGTSRRYCNGCYIVLGQIVETVSGIPYEDYVEQHVYRPAGMRTASGSEDSAPDTAIGYIREADGFRPNRDTRGARGSAAGGGYASLADLLAFDSASRSGRLGGTTASGGAGGSIGIAGGAPGLNAILESAGEWTVIVLSNFDPPSAQRLGPAIARRLQQ